MRELRAVVFDVNETLFGLAPLRERMVARGLPFDSLEPWFARVLRDGFAAAAAGTFAPFPELASHHLRRLAAAHDLDLDPAEILVGFQEVTAHDDVRDALETLSAAGVRAVTLTNGTRAITESFLAREGLGHLVARTFEVAEVGLWKPRPEPYLHVVSALGLEAAGQAALVAAHPWDVHGARSAGLRAGWVDRTGDAYPDHLAAPDATGTDLGRVVSALLGER